MRSVTLHETKRFRIISYGGGISYVIQHKLDNREVFFQGDDALTFEDELEALEKLRPTMTTDDVLTLVWHPYRDVATPIKD